MNITTKHARQLGFKGSGVLSDAVWHASYYRVNPLRRRVDVITNYTPQTISSIVLTPAQFKRFQAGKLSLVPSGCCNASGGKSISLNGYVIFSGKIKNFRQLSELVPV